MGAADARNGRAVVAEALGAPDGFVLVERMSADPAPGHVRIAVHASGVSFVDCLIAGGGYQIVPQTPYTPGTEFAGVIDAVGNGVSSGRIGERVCASALGGGFSEYAQTPSVAAIRIPANMTFGEAAIFRVSFSTAYHALVQRARLVAGDIVLVLGAGGGVGAACVQLASALGAKVIGSASTQGKRALALACGAADVIDSTADDWRDQVRVLTGGHGFDIIVDPVGGGASEAAFREIAWGGRFLVIGFAGGAIARFPTNLALLKGASVLGVDVRQFGERDPGAASENLRRLFEFYAQGAIRPRVGATYALDDFAAAMSAATSRSQAGRVVLTMSR